MTTQPTIKEEEGNAMIGIGIRMTIKIEREKSRRETCLLEMKCYRCGDPTGQGNDGYWGCITCGQDQREAFPEAEGWKP